LNLRRGRIEQDARKKLRRRAGLIYWRHNEIGERKRRQDNFDPAVLCLVQSVLYQVASVTLAVFVL
jgi:hypothetical protein